MRYFLIDKFTSEVKGSANITVSGKSKWEEKYNLLSYDKKFEGKKHYELKIKDGKVLKKTPLEIAQYMDAIPKPKTLEEQVRGIVLQMKKDGLL